MSHLRSNFLMHKIYFNINIIFRKNKDRLLCDQINNGRFTLMKYLQYFLLSSIRKITDSDYIAVSRDRFGSLFL